jgi:gluconate kinase
MTYWFFGLPGSGKSHVAKIFSEISGVPVIDADDFHTKSDREAIRKRAFTVERRHAQLKRVQRHLRRMKTGDAIVTHVLADTKSRSLLVNQSGSPAMLVYVTTPRAQHLKRLQRRKNHHFTADMLEEWIPRLWQEPERGRYPVIRNNVPKRELVKRLKALYKRSQNGEGRGRK